MQTHILPTLQIFLLFLEPGSAAVVFSPLWNIH